MRVVNLCHNPKTVDCLKFYEVDNLISQTPTEKRRTRN